jgi:hypothetical protein
MQQVADLELSLLLQTGSTCSVSFRCQLPQSETDVRSVKALVEIDPAAFTVLIPGSEEYGAALTNALFSNPEFKKRFAQALAVAWQNKLPLRLRLDIDPRAADLHSLIWEALRSPEDGAPLCTSENIYFSRYLSDQEWRPVTLRQQGSMNALLLVASPTDLPEYNLDPLDIHGEIERTREVLGGIPLTVLARQGLQDHQEGQPASVENLFQHLRQRKADGTGYFDILLLVCHGSLRNGQAWLWLEDDNGATKQVSGSELVTRFKELAEIPMLVVLNSCESARSEAGQVRAALGPLLSQAGVPAVLAMQGQISVETSAAFTQSFFKALQADGVIDLATSIARGAVRERPDHWMPALFMRLRSGRIWYLPGFGSESGDLKVWESLVNAVRQEMGTLILGPELIRPVLSDGHDIALRWADRLGYPFYPEDRNKLARVAQYVATSLDANYLRSTYLQALQEIVTQRFPSALPQALLDSQHWRPSELNQAIESASQAYWSGTGDNPYDQMARLGLKIYITSEQGDQLTRALQEAKREPQVRICPWNEAVRRDKELWYYKGKPSVEKPLVYHLYGRFAEPASLVFTEDEYFDYLINLTEHRDLIPSAVLGALAGSALFFLGFQLEDWQFRAFFRLIMNQPGARGLEEFSHVAAQIAPREGQIEDAERARLYLQNYLTPKKINLYWGSCQDFLSEMIRRL